MSVSGSWRNPIFINTIGHSAGVLLFGLIIGLLMRDWRSHGRRRAKLSLMAASLALGWNVGSLVVLASNVPASSAWIEFVATASFSMLSLLPAVLLQVAVRGRHRAVVAAGYIVSACAVVLHFCEPLFGSTSLHQAGLVSIVFGFAILTITAFLLGRKRGQRLPPEKSEWISLACLLLFTSSFLHFGYQHFRSPWAAEIAWHHIGIPVALIVLLRDYRFLLLDTFIRFLVNSGLAAVYIAVVVVLNEKFRLWNLIRPSLFLTAITLVVCCLLLISFASVRNLSQAWVSRVIFRRRKVDDSASSIVNLALSARSEEQLLTQAGQLIADHLEAERFAIVAERRGQPSSLKASVLLGEQSTREFPRQEFPMEALLPLRFSGGDGRCLILGSRRGGRRYRSEDLDDLRRLGATVVEQVERFRAEELRRLVNQAELRALQAQINPHFLFNALNTLYGTIDRGSRDARRMVINLAEIFRYFLRGHQAVIPLSEELRIVEAYLEIEALRLGDRLETELTVSDSVRSTLIPILSIQPLVENAVKHGVAAKQGPGRVSVKAEKLSAGVRITVAVQLAEEHPEFRFLLEDEVFVANFVESYRGSEELAEFRRLVKEGRIEIAPKWAAIYQNLPRGEALIRNVVYGKQYARDVFGIDPKVAHLGDIPGFTRQYAQILSKTDTPYMVMTRMGPLDDSLFRWKSPDGSKVLVWNTIKGYSWGVGLGLHRELDDASLAKISKSVADVQGTTRGPIYLEWGTDLWAPNEQLIENVKRLNQRLAPDRFRFATPSEFFRAAAQTPDIPVLSGEIPSSWANVITSLANLWPPVMTAADTLLTAEKFAAVNYALGYADYPAGQFDMLWKKALESMDHNNYGQGGDIGDARKLGYAQLASLEGGQILRNSLRNIAERVQHPFAISTPVVVFNPLNWTRDDVVKAHVTLFGDVAPSGIADYKAGMRLVDEHGTSVPFQFEQYSENMSRALDLVFVAQQVPSVGYKTYYLVPAAKPDTFPPATNVNFDNENDIKNPRRIVGSDVLENDFYRVAVDRATGLTDVFDKELDRDVLKNAQISASEERGGNSLSIEPRTGRTIINVIGNVALEEDSAVRTVMKIIGDIAGIPITQRVILYHALKKIDFENTIDWHPGRFMKIEQVFPLQDPNMEVRNGVPFGSASEADLMPGSGPHFRDEVPRGIWKGWRQVQNWISADNGGWTLTIGADHQFFDVSDGGIRGDMLRGIRFNPLKVVRNGQQILIEQPPAGTYTFRYSFSSGKGNWAANHAWRVGMALNAPLIPVTSLNELARKALPPQQSFLSVNGDNLVVSAIKKADRGDGVIVRLFDMRGDSAATPLTFLGRNRNFSETNMLEEDLKRGSQSTLHLRPYEIGTVRLDVAAAANPKVAR